MSTKYDQLSDEDLIVKFQDMLIEYYGEGSNAFVDPEKEIPLIRQELLIRLKGRR